VSALGGGSPGRLDLYTLAETAALLALSKKAEAIWGTTNDEGD
jgi:hypothetical protein